MRCIWVGEEHSYYKHKYTFEYLIAHHYSPAENTLVEDDDCVLDPGESVIICVLMINNTRSVWIPVRMNCTSLAVQ